MPTRFSVNLNKVALLRNTRDTGRPDVLEAARLCLAAGAEGVTVHPRPDQRHTRPDDVLALAELCRDRANIEFNIEGNPLPEFLELVAEARPDQCTLVPDDPAQRTSDHGWPMSDHDLAHLHEVVERLHELGARVSLFMDADLPAIERAAQTGADRIELYTEPYAKAFGGPEEDAVFAAYAKAAARAQELGMGVNAGHDLDLENTARLCSIPGILEVSIGHAFTADALVMGYAAAVRAYLAAIREGNAARG